MLAESDFVLAKDIAQGEQEEVDEALAWQLSETAIEEKADNIIDTGDGGFATGLYKPIDESLESLIRETDQKLKMELESIDKETQQLEKETRQLGMDEFLATVLGHRDEHCGCAQPLLSSSGLAKVGAGIVSRTQYIDTDDEAMARAIEESMLLQAGSC
mmetsp:Transcript_4161/g.7311  ORF Transcript_4161/g.7311 Transcript_4161/m.7311 type:complete len:159 (+) Transcript_4161:113-589(+)